MTVTSLSVPAESHLHHVEYHSAGHRGTYRRRHGQPLHAHPGRFLAEYHDDPRALDKIAIKGDSMETKSNTHVSRSGQTKTVLAGHSVSNAGNAPRWNARQAIPLVVIVVALLVCSGTRTAQATAPAWEVVPARNTGPAFIGGHKMVAIEKSLFVFGGFLEDYFNAENTFYREMWRFQTKTNTWKLLSVEGPSARAFHGMAADERAESIYVHGGATFNGDLSGLTLFSDFWRFDTRNGQWTQLDPVGDAKPGTLAGHQIAIIGDKLYLFGGSPDQLSTSNELWVYNINTNKWKQLRNSASHNNAPVRTSFVMQEAKIGDIRGLLIAQGEFLNTATFQFEQRLDTWFYSIAHNFFVDVTPPSAHNAAGLVSTNAQAVIQGNVLVYGGDLPGGQTGCGTPFPSNVHDTTWRFNLKTLRWSRLATANTPMPLTRAAGALIGEEFYLQGGFDFDCVDESLPAQTWNNVLYRIKPFDG